MGFEWSFQGDQKDQTRLDFGSDPDLGFFQSLGSQVVAANHEPPLGILLTAVRSVLH